MKHVFTILALILATSFMMFAGTTGKVAGQISDAETGEPLPGVNLQLDGTTLGAATDIDGVFVILNVPPGLYDLVISFIGYQTVRVKDVRVNVDFTTRVEQRLTSSAVELGEVEVVGERNPLVRADLTNTQVAVTAEEISSLPVDQLRDVIKLQAGIVEDNSGNLHIRGGRSNEVNFQVNGVSINNPFGNTQGVGLATNAVEEVSISAGTFSAEYGNALSGVINFVTKDGGPKYEASLRAWSGDNISPRDDIFFNIDEFDPLNNARAEWTLSGPIPLFGNKLTFITSGVYQNDKGHLYGIRLYNPSDMLDSEGSSYRVDPLGLDFVNNNGVITADTNRVNRGASGDREIVPMVTRESINVTGKLTWKPTHNLKLSYDLILDDGERYGSFRTYRFTPDGRPQTVSTNVSHSLGITHTLSKKMFYTLKLGFNNNKARTSVYEDPLDPRYLPVVILDENNNIDYSNDLSQLTIPNTGYRAGGNSLSHTTEEARTTQVKIDFVNQIHPSHELKFGAEYAQHELDLDAFTLFFNRNTQRFEIPTEDNNPNNLFFSRYNREPTQGAFYILDKMELAKRFIFNAGLRYEYLDTKALYNPDLAGTVDDGVDSPEFLEESEPKHRIMPRLSLSFPITSRGIIRFSYGIFYQNPTFRSIYRNPRFIDFDFQLTPTFGNPNLKPQRSVQYEMGLQQQLTEDFKIDLTVFYKDVNDLIELRRVVAGEVAIDKAFNVITNISYANIRGFTAALFKRRAPNGMFSAGLNYTYQIGEGSFTDPTRLAVDTRTGRQTAQKFIPLSFDRTHTLNSTLTLGKPGGWVASAIGTLQSGTPYTPSLPSSFQAVIFEVNSDRRPWIANLDLKLEKYFRFGDSRVSLFMQVENVIDNLQERFIHTNTGRSLTNLNETINTSAFNEIRDVIEFNELREELTGTPSDYFPIEFIDNFYQREDWLTSPREIRVGISIQP